MKIIYTGILILIVAISAGFLSCQAQTSTQSKDLEVDKQTSRQVVSSANPMSVEYLMGKFDQKIHPDFTEIPLKYADRPDLYLRKDGYDAFVEMYNSALQEGIRIQIRSATRNFEDQKRIWENKWTGKTILEDNINAATEYKDELSRAKKILEYSSMPGTSRHHWGTDMDINSFTNDWFDEGPGLKLYTWMINNAHKFGFCQPYTKMGSDRNSGYFEEKWHWSYMPVSQNLTKMVKEKMKNEMISGFMGSDTAEKIDMLKNYILGISPTCLTTKD
ncbi:MAG: M15 family metallopeptidase [Saprospiraceae bacterium]|nr:M15 family metallopeptidase [Saprospiraceae bacterium]